MIDLKTLKENWHNTPQFHQEVKDYCTQQVNETEMLHNHRLWVEQNIWGFGERAFHWVWKMIVDEMPSEFSFIECGVFKGQVLSLIKLLAISTGRKVKRYGITPLSTEGGVWESDYRADIEKIHDQFHLPKDYQLYVGLSQNPSIIKLAQSTAFYDIFYIDGNHEYPVVQSDLKHYAPLVKRGGWLIIDDSCNDLNQNFGEFCGIDSVTQATLEYMEEHGEKWEFCGNCVHLRFYKRR